jgi:hypothetical protein
VPDDVQGQFYMMSPYFLRTLSTDKKVCYLTMMNMHVNSGFLHFLSFQFITICVEGTLFYIFQGSRCLRGFPVQDEYQRLGYTSLSPSKQVTNFLLLLHGQHFL